MSLKALEKANQRMEKEVSTLKQDNVRLTEENSALKDTVDRLFGKVADLTDGAATTNAAIEKLHEIVRLPQDISNITTLQNALDEHFLSSEATAQHPELRTQFTAFACTRANVTLSCASGRNIFTTSGYYGRNHQMDCAQCCGPNPALDCAELIEENRPGEWEAIQSHCDGRNSCQFENQGSTIDGCEVDYQSDYMLVYYDCLPHDVSGAVGFTASANTGNTLYENGDVIVFDDVISNFGGHYNPNISTFICPWDGVYLFSVNVQGYLSATMDIDLMRNDVQLVEMMIDDITSVYNRASMTLVIDCTSGDVMWVRAGHSNYIHAAARRTLFAGYLLHRND